MTSTFSGADVRPANDSDVDALARIWFDGWHDAHARILPAELVGLRTLDSFRERMRAELHTVRVIDRSRSPIGFSMLRGAEVYQFYVSADARGGGAAAVLMQDAEAQLREHGVAIAWLACAVGNDRAARFYEKRGWRRAGTIINASETPSGPFPIEVWRYEKSLI